MANSDGPSAPTPQGVTPLPAQPDLKHLKQQAKRRLDELRQTEPAAKLADAQYAVAQQYGFKSWRALKAHVDAVRDHGSAMVQAVEAGDIENLQHLLDGSPGLVNAAVVDRTVRQLPTDTRAMRLLHVAVGSNQKDSARVLIERGADPDLRNADGRTALHDSLELGRSEIETLLRQHGATVDICSAAVCGQIDRVRQWLDADAGLANDRSTNLSPIGWASFGGRIEVIRLLAERGGELAAGETLWPAAVTGQAEFARQLIELGADVHGVCNQQNQTALHGCAMMHYTDDASGVAESLLEGGADVGARDADGRTPLALAFESWLAQTQERPTSKRFDRVIAVLRNRGGEAQLDQVDQARPGELAVRAALRGDAPLLRHVLELHPDAIDAAGGQWDQPLLHLAAWEGHIEVVELLLDRGFDVNLRDQADHAYALHFAGEKGHLPIVQRLVEAGGDVHGDGDDHALGVLGWATCLSGLHEEVADYLMQRGARLHIFSAIALGRQQDVRRLVDADRSLLNAQMSRNEHRRRPLHHAVACNRLQMVRLLLDLGADAAQADASGATPLTYASMEGGDATMIEMLLDAGAEMDLLSALGLGRFELAEALVKADPARIGPVGGDTIALHQLAFRNNAAAVRWLIGHGVDVNATRTLWDCNHTALHVCAEHGRLDIARLLLGAGADPGILDDKFNSSALGWAEHCKQPAVAELIRQSGRA